MADTDIKLSVDLDVASAEQTAQNLQKEIEGIFKNRKSEQSASLTQLELQMKQSVQKAQALRQELNKISQQKIPTEEYKEVSKRLEKLNAQFDKLLIKQDTMQELGQTSGPAWEKLNIQMEQLGTLIREDTAELQQLVDTGKAFTLGSQTEAFKKTQANLDAVNDKMKQQIVRHREVEYAEEQKAQKTEESNERVEKSNEKATHSYRRAGKTAVNEAHKIGSAFTKRLLPSVRSVRNAVTRMNHALTKGLRPATNNVKRLATRFIMLSLGARSMFALLRKVRTAIIQSFGELQESGISPITGQIKELKATLSQVKNSFVAAFEPIITMILPYLQRMAEALGNVIDKLAQFIAVLAGKNTYIRAIKQVGDTVEESGDKASGSLASFDKLNNITFGNESTKDKNKTQYEEVKVDESVATAAQSIKKKLDKIIKDFKKFKKELKKIINKIKIGDWLGASADLGGLVDKLLTKITEKIKKFIPTTEQAEKLGQAIAEFLKNAHLMDHLGSAVDILCDVIKKLFTIAFSALGSFSNAELEQLGKDFADMIIKILDTIIWVLENFDASKIGYAFKGILDKSWEIITKIAKAMKLLVQKAFSALWTAVTGTELSEGAEDALGEAIIMGILAVKIGKVVGSIIGSTGLLSAFKKKDKAFGRQTPKVEEEAGAFDTLTDSVGAFTSVVIPSIVGVGLLSDVFDLLFGNETKTNPAIEQFNSTVEALGEKSETSSDEVQPLISAVQDLGEEADESTESVNDLKTSVKNLANIGMNSYQLSGIQAISNTLNGIETSAKNARLEIENLQKSLNTDYETEGSTSGAKTGIVKGTSGVTYNPQTGEIYSPASGISAGASEEKKKTTPAKTVSYADIEKYAKEHNMPLTSANMTAIAQHLATGEDLTFKGAYTGSIKMGTTKTISIGDMAKVVSSGNGVAGGGAISMPDAVSWEALLKAYGGDEKKAWDAYSYVMSSSKFQELANALENGSSEEKILRLLKEQEELGLDFNIQKWIDRKADESEKTQNSEKIKALIKSAGQEGTSGVYGIFEMIKRFFNSLGVPLARGAVIPAGKPFLAMLGDQKSGTNVEAPLDTIKQALAEVLSEVNMGATFQVIGDPHGMFKVVQKEANNYTKATGRLAF